LNKQNKIIKFFGKIGVIASIAIMSASAWALTAETTLTIVHQPRILFSSANIAPWDGAWPTSINAELTATGEPNVSGKDVYLNAPNITNSDIFWNSIPFIYPYKLANPSAHTINTWITTVYSPNGADWNMGSWDFLFQNTHAKHLENGPDGCWQGTVVNTLADNGKVRENIQERFRSNVFFSFTGSSSELNCAAFSNQIQNW